MENMNKKMRARVDLITGFLGAGKTSLIRRYIRYLDERGISYVVIENEFGAAGVDASILGGNVRELSGGCICCGQKVNFHNLLIEMAAEAERIIIEPSGVFNADDFFDIMDSPQVRAVAECGFMAGVVDPMAAQALSGTEERVLYSEIVCAGAIVWSHMDLAEEAQTGAARDRLHALLGELPAEFDGRSVDFARLMEHAPVRRAHERDRSDHSTLFQSAVLYPEGVYEEESLRKAARALFAGDCGQVIRVKGTVKAGKGMLTVNATVSGMEICEGSGEVGVNVIGRGLRRKIIRSIFEESRNR